MASKSTKSGAYEMLVAQKNAITRITGIITPESIDGLDGVPHDEVLPVERLVEGCEPER